MTMLQNHQVSVLVVDPDADTRGQIHDVMMSDGYACRAVSTAAEAKRIAAERSPNLLICDMNLGDGSGLELLADLRGSLDCPVVFISDSRKPETVQHALSRGCNLLPEQAAGSKRSHGVGRQITMDAALGTASC